MRSPGRNWRSMSVERRPEDRAQEVGCLALIAASVAAVSVMVLALLFGNVTESPDGLWSAILGLAGMTLFVFLAVGVAVSSVLNWALTEGSKWARRRNQESHKVIQSALKATEGHGNEPSRRSKNRLN